MDAVDLNKAAGGRKVDMWTDPERYPEIAEADMGMQGVEIELEEELVSSAYQYMILRVARVLMGCSTEDPQVPFPEMDYALERRGTYF